MTGIELIAAERQEQIEKHGITIDSDVTYNDAGQLALGAMLLLSVDFEEGVEDPASYPSGWNPNHCERMIRKPYKERIIIAAALLAAEIDRLNANQK